MSQNDEFKEYRKEHVQGKITSTMKDRIDQIILRSDEQLNQSEIIYLALNMYISREYTERIETIMVQNKMISIQIESKNVLNALKKESNWSKTIENCVNTSLILAQNPKEPYVNRYLKDLAIILIDMKISSAAQYNLAIKLINKTLNKNQRTDLLIYCNLRYTCISRIHSIEGIQYIGGTLNNDNPESEICNLANDCVTVPTNQLEQKMEDCVGYILQKWPDRFDDYVAVFENRVNVQRRQNK